MSDAANPVTGPAGTVNSAESVIDKLLAEQAAADTADTAQQPAAAEPAAEEPAEPPPADTSEAPEPEPEAAPPEKTYRVKVRGEEVEVTERELLDGYSRTQDYKAKTAEIAEQRRALEKQSAEFAARASQLDQLLSTAPYDQTLVDGQKTDWIRLAQEDPAGYVQQRAAYDARVQFWNGVMQQRAAAAQEAHQRALAASQAELERDIPEWRDTGKRADLVKQLGAALKGYGFSEQELAGLADHRIVRVALDAMKFRQQGEVRQAAEAKKVTPQPSRVLRPGAAPTANGPSANAKALLQKAQQSRRLDDQVNAVLANLGV